MSSGFIYVIQMEGTSFYKIGRTTDLNRRMSSLGTLLPTRRVLHIAIRVDDHERLETTLHEELAALRRNGEWFELEPIHLERISAFLLFCQGEDLVRRAVLVFNADDLFPNNLKRWSRFFAVLARRQERRLIRSAGLLSTGRSLSAVNMDHNYEEAECHA